MKKLVEKFTELVQKEYENEEMRGKKARLRLPGSRWGKPKNAEGVLPSMATETVDDIVLQRLSKTAGMAETIDEKAAFGKSGRKKPENMLDALQRFLTIRYDFRYNLLTEQTEYRGKEVPDEEYAMVAQT